jgi:Family of unknown function (DUF5681)
LKSNRHWPAKARPKEFDMIDDNKDTPRYDIGYKKPPKANSWKPGQSGNPSGNRRERPGPSFSNTLKDVYAEIVTFPLNGKPTSMTRKEWFVENLGMRAANGDVKKLRLLLDLYDTDEPNELPPIIVEITAEEARALGPVEQPVVCRDRMQGGQNGARDQGGASDGDVGYKRPPKHTQFKPGNSARRGKTRKSTPDMGFPAIINRMLERRVKVPIGAEFEWMTMLELITRQMVIAAANGNDAAARVLKRLSNLKRERVKRKERRCIVRIDGIDHDGWERREVGKKDE